MGVTTPSDWFMEHGIGSSSGVIRGSRPPTGVGEQNEIKYQLRIDPMTPRNPLRVVLGVIVGVATPSERFIKKEIDG